MKPAEKLVQLLQEYQNNPMGLAGHFGDIVGGAVDIVRRLEAVEVGQKQSIAGPNVGSKPPPGGQT